MENKYFTLNNGVKMPCCGLGVFQNKDAKLCKKSVICAIENGYRMIDTAKVYGNEQAVGSAIKNCGVPREELFITTKLWFADCGYKRAKKALELSLERLGLDYVDLYLIHEPYGWVKNAWRAMEECMSEGKIRAIGVSNFGIKELEKLAESSDTLPAVNQIELHPFFQRKELLAYLKGKNILPEAWAPFAEGKLDIFRNPAICGIAKAHGCTAAQVILAWLHAQGVAVIPKSSKEERIKENGEFLKVNLSGEDMRLIDSLDRGESLFPWDKGYKVPLRKALGFFHLGI